MVSSATDKGDDFNGIIGLKRNSVVVTPWDEFAVSLDRARRTGLAEVLKQVDHIRRRVLRRSARPGG